MTRRQLWVYNYTPRMPRMGLGGVLAPINIPALETFTCLKCSAEIHVLRNRARSKGQNHTLLKTFQGYHLKDPEECECGALVIEVDDLGRLMVYVDDWSLVSLHTYNSQDLKLFLAHSLYDVGYYTSPPLETFSPYQYKRAPWKMEFLRYLNMDQFTPRERLEVLPSTDADRAFFLRQYAFTYKVVVFEEGYVYLPSGRRKAQRGNPHWNPWKPRLAYEEYLDLGDNPRLYPEYLIYNLHLYSTKSLRLELEGLTDPFHMANLTLQHSRPLKTP